MEIIFDMNVYPLLHYTRISNLRTPLTVAPSVGTWWPSMARMTACIRVTPRHVQRWTASSTLTQEPFTIVSPSLWSVHAMLGGWGFNNICSQLNRRMAHNAFTALVIIIAYPMTLVIYGPQIYRMYMVYGMVHCLHLSQFFLFRKCIRIREEKFM